ncbi:MAG: hypothetical protein ACRDT5_14845 [Mycobacterium sp.]
MSRTDKTAPFWVKLQRGDIASIEVHDHRRGACDIDDHDGGYRPRRCHREFLYTGTNVCCCPMCHGREYPDRSVSVAAASAASNDERIVRCRRRQTGKRKRPNGSQPGGAVG